MKRYERVKALRDYHSMIVALKKKEDKIFSSACSALEINEIEEPRSTILFDILFNGEYLGRTFVNVEKQLWPVGAAAKRSVTSGSKPTPVPSQPTVSCDPPTTVSATDAWQKP